MRRDVLSVLISIAITGAYTPFANAASQPQLNFKIYAPDAGTSAKPAAPAPSSQTPAADSNATPAESSAAPAADTGAAQTSAAPAADSSADTTTPAASDSASSSSPAAEAMPQPVTPINPPLQSETPEAATPDASTAAPTTPAAPAASSAFDTTAPAADAASVAPATDATTAATPAATDASAAAAPASAEAAPDGADKEKTASKVLQGYVRVVPTGTRIPIIMDTAVDSDTSQEGDEFEARTAEDLDIDGQIAVPAGSVIKGRIAQLAAPKHMMRGGSVSLKFDTVTTPDNRQIPLVANLVARGGVVHAKRGGKDYLIDAGTFIAPLAAGLAIGVVAGNASSSSSIGPAGGALIGAGVGGAVGLAILLAKKGKKIDVRPGDEMKIELAEDLRMPMM